MPNKKKMIFYYYTQAVINIIIVFPTQYFQRKKMIQWLEFPLQPKGFNV